MSEISFFQWASPATDPRTTLGSDQHSLILSYEPTSYLNLIFACTYYSLSWIPTLFIVNCFFLDYCRIIVTDFHESSGLAGRNGTNSHRLILSVTLDRISLCKGRARFKRAHRFYPLQELYMEVTNGAYYTRDLGQWAGSL